jgi:hypothetical protein
MVISFCVIFLRLAPPNVMKPEGVVFMSDTLVKSTLIMQPEVGHLNGITNSRIETGIL